MCLYSERLCTKCVCQSCCDDFHRCIHKRTPTTLPRPFGEMDSKSSVYMDTYVEHPYRPPVIAIKPDHHDLLRLGQIETERSTYSSAYTASMIQEEEVYKPLVKHRPPTPQMEKQSVYMKDYGINLHPTQRDLILERQRITLEAEEKVKQKGSPLSFPKRPPRPYDYSKCEDELTGVIYVPRLLRKHRQKDNKVAVILPIYHSDGAPSSYFGGSIKKMAYRAGLDHRHMPCCRPEMKFHPERLQKCLDVQPDGSDRPCPKYIYEIPDTPVWANQESFIGIKATFSMDTTYQDAFKDHYANSVPNPRLRDYDPATEPIIELENLPMEPGFVRCEEGA